MRISDWSSDVCSSDLCPGRGPPISLLFLRRVCRALVHAAHIHAAMLHRRAALVAGRRSLAALEVEQAAFVVVVREEKGHRQLARKHRAGIDVPDTQMLSARLDLPLAPRPSRPAGTRLPPP